MSSDSHYASGRISSINHRVSKNDKEYYLLIIRFNIPFKTKYLKFCVWNDNKLNYANHVDARANEGDDVYVSYYYEGHFPILTSIHFIEGGLGDCPCCFAFYEQNYSTQPRNCPDCQHISSKDRKERIDSKLQLIDKKMKYFKYSQGLCLKLFDETTGLNYSTTIFEKNPIFESVVKFELKKSYRVVGWKENGKFSDIDIVDVYDEL